MDRGNPSELAKRLKQCFTPMQFAESKVPELASIQTKLLLKQNPEIPFGNEVSFDTISQLTKVFCNLGSTTVENENDKLKRNIALADRYIATLRELLQKKRTSVHLADNEKAKLLNNIQSYKDKLNELKSNCEQAAPPQLNHNEQMQNQFCEKLEGENEALQKEIEQFQEYAIFEGITTNAQLERAIKEKENLHRQNFKIDSPPPNKASSRLSFSFDESSQEF